MELLVLLGLGCVGTVGVTLLARRRRELQVITPDPVVAARAMAALSDVGQTLLPQIERPSILSSTRVETVAPMQKKVPVCGGLDYEPTEEDAYFTAACREAFAQCMEYGFYCPIAEVSHSNDDGISRRLLLRDCGMGERLTLVHESRSRYRLNAVAIQRFNGDKLGYLPAQAAQEWVRAKAEGRDWLALFRKHTFIPDTARVAGGVIFLMCLSYPEESTAQAAAGRS